MPIISWTGTSTGSQDLTSNPNLVFTTPGTYNLTTDAPVAMTFRGVAGGGGGAHGTSVGGGAGGGGAYTNGLAITLVTAKTYTLTVGAGGVANTSNGGTTALVNTTDGGINLVALGGGVRGIGTSGGTGGVLSVGSGGGNGTAGGNGSANSANGGNGTTGTGPAGGGGGGWGDSPDPAEIGGTSGGTGGTSASYSGSVGGSGTHGQGIRAPNGASTANTGGGGQGGYTASDANRPAGGGGGGGAGYQPTGTSKGYGGGGGGGGGGNEGGGVGAAGASGVALFVYVAPLNIALNGTMAVALSAIAALTTIPALTVASTLAVGSDSNLTVQGPLLSAATISVGTTAPLAHRAALAAAATIPFATIGTAVVFADLSAESQFTLNVGVTYAERVVADGASHYWRLGELSGTTAYDSVGTAHGTISGGVTLGVLGAVTDTRSLPRLTIGSPLTVAATSSLRIGCTAALGTLPATFTTAPGVRVGTTASLTQFGVGAADVIIAIGGAVTARIRIGSIEISDILNEAPNTCTFIAEDDPPAVGVDVKIGLQNLLVPNLLFAGTVKRRAQVYEARTENLYWTVDCEDYTYLLNRRRVFGTWTNVSASTIARAILTTFTSGFSQSGIVDALPPVTVTFTGTTVMDALTQLAGLIGGYTKVDYGKVVWLFITDPGVPPAALTPTTPTLQYKPPITPTLDVSQTRTRVHVRGAAVSVVGPSDGTITASPIPISDATPFASGKVIADDGQILPYTGTSPGNLAAIIVGNVPGPTSAGTPALAPGVAGRLSGTYRWAVAFGNPQGETPVGPQSAALFCPDVTSPTSAPGIGATGTVGPLVGAYDYRISYLTTLGETLAGPSAHRVAAGLAPPVFSSVSFVPGASRLSPGVYKWVATYVTPYGETVASTPITATQADLAIPFPPSVTGANGPGPLVPGATYRYRATFVTPDGESAPGTPQAYTPIALQLPTVGSFNPNVGFGGLSGGAYYYGITYVTALGESPMNTVFGGSGLAGPYPGWVPAWSGGQDTNGSIERGYSYVWAASYYADTYGESFLGPQSSAVAVGGTLSVRLLMNISNFHPTGADGVRIYRAMVGGPFLLNKEFRFASGVPTQYWDDVSQANCGSTYPIQTLRAGAAMQALMNPSAETGVIARRLYRTKAGGAEYFLVAEIQSNASALITDYFFDNQLAQRNPAQPTTGRLGLVSVPTGTTGTIGRRVYRSKRDDSVAYWFLGELRDNTTPTLLDGIADESLVSSMPTANTGGSSNIPILGIPTGPPGVLTRRLYRTKANGSTYALVAELNDNTTTSVTDNTPDSALIGAAPPPLSSAGGDQHLLTSLPIGPTGTLARLIYRTKSGGGEYGEVARVSDNTTTTFLDTVPDENLGGGISLVNEAGSSAVNLTSIPIGPAGVTTRIIYRTLAGGSDLYYVGTLDNNTATTYLDTRADSALGRAPQPTSTIGALVGDTFLALNTTAGFPAPGWVRVENQYVRYASISGTTLAGIPATGTGAIIAPVRGGAAVLTVAQLTGVTGLVDPLPVGSRLALWVTSDSLPGQAALAAVEGGDGVHEFIVADPQLETIAACLQRGQAELALFQYAQVSLEYASRDRLTRSGATVSVNLPAPWNLVGDFVIQSVRITEIAIAPKTFPKYLVRCSDTKFSLEDLLRHVVLVA